MIANCFNFMTVELLESRLEKEPYVLANKAKGKIEFNNMMYASVVTIVTMRVPAFPSPHNSCPVCFAAQHASK